MIILDMRTVILLNVIIYFICTMLIVQLWRQNSRRFAGIAFWVFNLALQTVALALIVLRGAIPDWISIVLANTLMFAGALLVYMGLERFVEKISAQLHNYVLFALYTGTFVYSTFIHPDLHLRTLIMSVGLLIISFQCLWLLWCRVEPDTLPMTFGVGMVFGGYCLVSVVRIVEYFVGAHAGGDYFQSGAFQTLVLVSYQMLFILLTYSLILMVNKRLFMAIRTQEEKFAKAFHSAPYAVTLTRLSDGTMVDVNESFVAITGYDRVEAIGKKAMDLYIWEHQEDRAAVVDALSRNGKMHGMELRFRKKTGEAVTGLFSAELITIDGEKNILCSISDITERKKAEEALRTEMRFINNLIQASPAFFVAIGADGKIIMMNDSFLNALGYSHEQVVGKDYLPTIVPEEDRLLVSTIFEKLVISHEPSLNENHVLTRDGRELLVEWHGRPVFNDQGNFLHFFGVGIDITDRKRAEEERKSLEERLQRAEKMEALGTLAGGVAHDLNNVLGIVVGYAEMLLVDADKSSPMRPDLLNIMNGRTEGSCDCSGSADPGEKGSPRTESP